MPERGSLLRPPHTCWRVVDAQEAGVLVDARDYYLAFYRAALKARRSILMSGWQFDSTVELLRGDDVAVAEAGKVRLIEFLNHLCETRPDLRIEMLAWDFHVVLAFEREWLQKLVFHWRTHERLRFRFDDKHPDGACHHQKFVVIDGSLAFVGGMDICEARWDDRRHAEENPVRLSRGKPQKPYHDAQAYIQGADAVAPLVEYFAERWRRSGGDELERPAAEPVPLDTPEGALVLPGGPVAISRTDPVGANGEPICEVRELLVRAIEQAQTLIYLETQYFSSREVREALERRMRAGGHLDIVLVLNERAEAAKEQLAVGLRQAENLKRLRRVAAETGHALGCYFTVAERNGPASDEPERRTYIHTKLAIVDDELLTVGSANLTNRSLAVDTELHLSWETAQSDAPDELRAAIRRVRVSLLAEHTGRDVEDLARTSGLVAALDALADGSRLRHHPSPTPDEEKALAVVDPQELPFDPDSPEGDEDVLAEDKELLRASIAEVWGLLTGDAKAKPPRPERKAKHGEG